MSYLFALLFWTTATLAVTGREANTLVWTTSGQVQGFVDSTTTNRTLNKWLGVRYAEDTSGRNRWKPPQPIVPSLKDIFNASAYGPACLQGRLVATVKSKPDQLFNNGEI
jgi:carboxylesterase type B